MVLAWKADSWYHSWLILLLSDLRHLTYSLEACEMGILTVFTLENCQEAEIKQYIKNIAKCPYFFFHLFLLVGG